MAQVNLPNADSKFATGQPAYGTDITGNVNALLADYNGNITDYNISASAAIADSKLAQITTAGKVSTAALTGIVAQANTRKTLVIAVTGPTDTLNVGDGQFYFTCPAELNGMNLVAVGASVITTSSSGTPTIQIARGRRSAVDGACTYVDMLSTRITIDATEFDSANAAAAAVINTSNDDIVSSTYVDLLRIDVDTAGTNAQGLEIRMSFQTP
jgi:hypothetical protein